MKKKLFLAVLAASFAFGSVHALAISDDIYSFEFELDGEEYALPMTYADFIAHGWTTTDDASTEISPNQYGWLYMTKGDLEVTIDVINLSMNTLPMDQCDVAGFEAEEYYVSKAPDTKLVLPGGIEFGVSTLDDVTAAYGPASDTYEGDSYTKLSYSVSVYQEVEITVDKETGVIDEVDYQNFDTEKCATASMEANVSDEIPACVQTYKAPTELGDDITSGIIDFAGTLYSVPCPVSVLLETGWDIAEKPEEVVAGKQSGWVTLMKDNQQFRILAKNYDANATAIENCFVTEFTSSSLSRPDVPLTIQKGITMGMSADDMLAALEGTEYEISNDSDSFTYYIIYTNPDSKLDYIELVVRKEDNTLMQMEVRNQPRTLE